MPSNKTWELSRRHVLRGIGVSMGLPLLEAMVPKSLAAATKTATGVDGQPVRFAGFFMTNGVNHDKWSMEDDGKIKELSESLASLEAVKDQINVFRGLQTAAGGHNLGTSSFLSGRTPQFAPNAADVDVGNATIDQIIGAAYPGAILPSLELSMSSPRSGLDLKGSTRVYMSYISWKNSTTPVPNELNPARAFDRLFRDLKTTQSTRKNRKRTSIRPNKSVLDLVLEDAKSLRKRVGRADQQKLDQYLTAVHEVEERMISQGGPGKDLVVTPEMAKEINSVGVAARKAGRKSDEGSIRAVPEIPYREYGRLMMDIMALAFWSNSTRASTLMFGDGLHTRNMSFLDGVTGNHHSISHHGSKEKSLEMFAAINRFYAEQYSYFLQRLKSMEEGSGNVLDNSIVLLGSNMGDGQFHNKRNIPIIVGGNGGGRIKTGRNVVAEGSGVPELLRSVLDTMNLDPSLIGGKSRGKGTLKDFRS